MDEHLVERALARNVVLRERRPDIRQSRLFAEYHDPAVVALLARASAAFALARLAPMITIVPMSLIPVL